MPDNYNFNPALNREKLLAFTPPVRSSFSSLASKVPDTETCLRKLEKLCRQAKKLPNKLFDKHIGENATYSSKELLKEALKLIYCCFVDKHAARSLSDDRRSQLIDLLTQDIDACTAGFHNRANLVLDQLKQPENLEQLFYNARECLAAAITEEMLKDNNDFSVGRGDEVHFGNRVRIIANQLGLGIKPILRSDPYRDQRWDDQIAKGLKETFERYLTPFHLPILLADQIKDLLFMSGYSGFKEEGYTIGLVDEFMLMLRKFMPSLCANKNDDYLRQRYLQIETGTDDLPYIQDINWLILRQDIYQVLKEGGYFKKLPTPCSLAEVIQQCILFNKWEDFGIYYKTLDQAFPSYLSSSSNLCWSIQGLNVEQCTVVFEACKDKLSTIIKEGADFDRVIQDLNVEQRTVVIRASKDILATIIKDGYDFNWIIEPLTPEQRIIVFEACKAKLPIIIKDGTDFGLAIKHLTPEQRTAVFEACKATLPIIIKNIYHLSRATQYLTLDQHAAAIIGCKDILPAIIKCGHDLGWIIENLTLAQRTVIFEACKNILPTITRTIKNLVPSQHTMIFEAYKGILPTIIKDGTDFGKILQSLTPDQCVTIMAACEDTLPTFIKDGADFGKILQSLTPNQCIAVILACEDILPTIVKDGADFAKLLQPLVPAQCTAVMTACEDILPIIIKDSTNFIKAIQFLIPNHRKTVFEACKNFPFIMKKSDELMNDILKENNKVQTLYQKKQEQFDAFIRQYRKIERKSESIMKGVGKYFFKKISQEKKSVLDSMLHDEKYILKIEKVLKDKQYYNDDLVDIRDYLNNLESTITSSKINILKHHRGFFKLHDTTSDKLVIEFKEIITQLKQEVESTIPKEPIIELADLAAAFKIKN